MFSDDFWQKMREIVRDELAQKEPPPPPKNEYMNVTQAAEYLGVSKWTIYVNSEKGTIPFVRVGAKAKRFLKTDLDAWANSAKENMPDHQFDEKVETQLERLRNTKKPKQ